MACFRPWRERARERILAIFVSVAHGAAAYGILTCGAGELVSGRAVAAPSPAGADDDFDDPKLARELAAARSAAAAAPKRTPVPTPTSPPTPVAKTTPVTAPSRSEPAPPKPVAKTTPVTPPPRSEPAPAPPTPVAGPSDAVAPHAPSPFLIAPPLPPPPPSPAPASAPVGANPVDPARSRSAPATPPARPVSEPARGSLPPTPAPAPVAHEDHAAPQTDSVRSDLAAKTADGEPGPSTMAPGGEARGPWSYAPRAKLAYRRFGFSRMPVTETSPTGSTTTTAAPAAEAFESLSLDLYPMSSFMRIGFSSQFGWESGQFQRTGDYFLAESATLGIQWPGRFTPFAEALAGAGYMRRRLGTSDKPSAYWQLGVDAGVEIYFAKRAYGSLALGYLRPGNLFYADKALGSIKLDTWSLKVGVGI